MTPQLAFLLNQCVTSLQADDERTAEVFLEQALQLAPDNPDVLRFFGILEAKRQNFDTSLSYFQGALKEAPRDAFVNSNIGNVLLELKRYEDALNAYDEAISIEPNYAEVHNNKGNALQALERYDQAICAYDRAISIDPNDPKSYSNKGNALQKLKRYEDALSAYSKAISIDPNYSEAYCNKGIALHELNFYQEALCAYDKTILIDPNYAEAYSSKSKALQLLRLYHQALEAIKMAIQVRPDYAAAHLDAAVLYFKLFDFIPGWEEYEWRWLAANTIYPKYISNKPEWGGEKTNDRILVLPEQGVGDKILFSTIFKELSLFSPKIIVSTDSRLIPIFRRSFPNLEFIDENIALNEDEYDLYIAAGSLFKYFRKSVESFGKSTLPFLLDDQDQTTSLRQTLTQVEGGKTTCGIAWRSANKEVGDHKSIPLAKMAPILELTQFEFINLQYGEVDLDLKDLHNSSRQKIHQIPGIDLYDDLDGTLSLIEACDLIITCSNSVAHMAGALNKQTILMIPFEAGKFWYWNEVDGHSLCYPSIKVFCQSQQGNWDTVIDQVKVYMENLYLEQ